MRLAVLCIAPVPGHLIPLLKTAGQARCSGSEVHVIVPDEMRHVAEFYGFNCHTFGKVKEGCDVSCMTEYLQAGEISQTTNEWKLCISPA
jgi:hypothetical protein